MMIKGPEAMNVLRPRGHAARFQVRRRARAICLKRLLHLVSGQAAAADLDLVDDAVEGEVDRLIGGPP